MKRILSCLLVSACLLPAACRTRVSEVEPSESFRKALDEVMQRQPNANKVKPSDLERRREPIVLKLSLTDALELAATRNRALLFEQLSIELARTNTMASKSRLDFTAGANFSYMRDEGPVTRRFPGDSRDKEITGTTGFGLSATLPFATGTTLDLSGGFQRVDSNSPFSTFEFFPSSTLKVTQNLLNGVGFVPNLSNTWIAEGNERIAELNMRSARNLQAYNVAVAYWNLVEAQEDLKVLRRQEELARDALELAKNRREAGLGTRLDELAQESNVAAQQRGIIQAEALEETRSDELLRAMHPDLLTGYSLFENYRIVIQPSTQADAARLESFEPSLMNELKGALRKRAEIEVARKRIENAGLAIRRDEYGLLPTLDVSGELTVNGFGQQFDDSLDNYTDFDNLRYGVTLTFGVPIQNRAARAALDASVIEKRQAILDAREAETNVITEVALAVRTIKSAKRGVVAAEQARKLADETYQAEQERQKAGLATAFEVKQSLNDLTAAERDLIKARVELEKARLGLLKATGELGQ
ncbi:MAG: hypothetical protein BroJett014_20300 [Planctomycetota bacterium]|nr:hypothetical protein [Planctomycetota bacterium]GIK53057.1 MAG: hypothetical protein BroJett014_20300 [Planctomycetota bacterium]